MIVDDHDLQRLLDEKHALERQVGELQTAMSKMVESSLARRVREFHKKFGHAIATRPAVPDDETVRFRLRLIAEEFFELLGACGVHPYFATANLPVGQMGEVNAEQLVRCAINGAVVDVHLPEVADALADLAYVVEGGNVVFGINAEPIAAEVHRANIEKDAVYVEAKDGFHMGAKVKPTKPPTWRAPDIVGELRKQGWMG